ncbi:hypothetical protein, conserved [Plasmodium gonderi]|uniref:Uncharacterized protein n=1 Tax=Plasmodium gonderi TaxID=77519 RepID=A0A1Y1JJH6_PLAGO|nr:hypothetical protein, conserved [Plasmodium gonderi]GAW82390.1 hypothetical protein, conserved [Plasmodium gonderi]
MKHAEYYPNQNIVSINIQFNSWTKAFLNYLRIAENFVSSTKASIIIKKKKDVRNFHLYKIKLRLIYGNDLNGSNTTFVDEKMKKWITPLDDHLEQNSNLHSSPRSYENQNLINPNHDTKGKIKSNLIHNEQNNVRTSSEKAIHFNKIDERNDEIIDKVMKLNRFQVSTWNKKMDESKTQKGTKWTSSCVLNKRGDKEVDRDNLKNATRQLLREKKKGDKHLDIVHVLVEKNVISKDLSIFKKKDFSKYIFLPAYLSLKSAKIKSVHFLLNDKMSINLLLNLMVRKSKTNFLELSINKELNDMLKLKRFIIQCKSCNENVMICGNVNFILPNMYLNTTDFLEHAFCEECTTFTFDGIKDIDRNIFIFPNYLLFRLSLIKDSNLALQKNSVHQYRFLFFCNFCHNLLGYFENENHHTHSYHENKNMNDNLKKFLFDIIYESDKPGYVKLETVMFQSTCHENPYSQINEKDVFNSQQNGDEVTRVQKPSHKRSDTKEGLNFSNELIIREVIDTEMLNKEEDTNINPISNLNDKCQKFCGDINPKIYLLKHKIKMLLNEENIFKNYNNVIFLNEYMHSKCEKKNITIFYLRNNQKGKIIEVRIFIKMLYICKIMDPKICHNNFLDFQKVMKILYCVIKNENKFKFPNSETIDISKQLYEDILKMMISYSFRSDIFKGKFLSYLLLIN